MTGRGSILMRAKSEIETNKKGDRQALVINEIPYQVNKARLIERIAELVREKTIEGISDLRDESDRDGMRIVIELKRGEVPEVVLNNLYKHTQLQMSFGIIMLAIVGGRPKVLTLLELIESFVEFRREVVRRRTEFELRKAEARYHILEGLKIALDHLDAVITLIRGSKTVPEAREGLMTQFGLSQIQSQAILDLQLHRLTGLERQKILDELAELLKTIERLRAILASERLLMQIIVDELKAVREKYGDDRRTEIVDATGEINVEDLIAEEDMAITVSNTGYIKRTAISTYRNQRRGGKGRIGMRTRDEDFVSHLFVASTHAYIMIFSDRGRAYWLKVHEIPDVGPGGKGKSIANLVSMEEGEKIAATLPVKEFEEDKFVVMGTLRGVVKKTSLSAFSNPRAGGIIAIGRRRGRCGDRGAADRRHRRGLHRHPRRDGDSLQGSRRQADGTHGLRRARHHPARRGLRGGDGDRQAGGTLLTVTERGYGKRTEIEEYRVTSRGGFGSHQHLDLGPERSGGGLRLRAGRRRAARDHAAGHDPADADRWRPRDRARDARRENHRHRGRGQGRLDRAAGGKRGRGTARRRRMSCGLLLVVALAAAQAACAPRPEAPILGEFFNASRLRDRTALQKIATTSFDPAAHGIITSFDITAVVTREAAGRASKDVSISAPVKLPDGQTLQKDLVVTLERDGSASGSAAERWIVTAIRDAAAAFASASVITHWPSCLARPAVASRVSTVGRPCGSGVVTSTVR